MKYWNVLLFFLPFETSKSLLYNWQNKLPEFNETLTIDKELTSIVLNDVAVLWKTFIFVSFIICYLALILIVNLCFLIHFF